MNKTRLRTIEQLEEFLRATPEVAFTASGVGSAADNQRCEHISRVLARLDYPQRNKRERGVMLAYLRRTSGYGRAQVNRLVARWAKAESTLTISIGWVSSNAAAIASAAAVLPEAVGPARQMQRSVGAAMRRGSAAGEGIP